MKEKDVDYRKICKTDIPKNCCVFHYKGGLLRTASTLSAGRSISRSVGRSVGELVGWSVRVFHLHLVHLHLVHLHLVINLTFRRSCEIHVWLYIVYIMLLCTVHDACIKFLHGSCHASSDKYIRNIQIVFQYAYYMQRQSKILTKRTNSYPNPI